MAKYQTPINKIFIFFNIYIYIFIYIYIYIYIYIIYEINACHIAYEGFPHICIDGTITWGRGELVECGAHTHVIVPYGTNMMVNLICNMICIFFIYVRVCSADSVRAF